MGKPIQDDQKIASIQARRNGFEHGGDSKYTITFEPFILQTSNLQFWKWQIKSQNMVGTSPHVPIHSGGPVMPSMSKENHDSKLN